MRNVESRLAERRDCFWCGMPSRMRSAADAEKRGSSSEPYGRLHELPHLVSKDYGENMLALLSAARGGNAR